MSRNIYKPSAVKHFRALAEGWRAHAKALRVTIKRMEASRAAGEIDYEYRSTVRALTAEATYYEKLGKELKELASDVLNDRVGVLC
jgi:hypothetical protein